MPKVFATDNLVANLVTNRPLLGDRIASIATKAPLGNSCANRRLTTLVLINVYQPQHPVNRLSVKAFRNNGLGTFVALDIALENFVERLVGRQVVLIFLIRRQFGRRWAFYDALWNGSGAGIAESRQLKYAGLNLT